MAPLILPSCLLVGACNNPEWCLLVAAASMEHVISRSFNQFQHERKLPEMAAKLAALRQEADAITTASDADVGEHLAMQQVRHQKTPQSAA